MSKTTKTTSSMTTRSSSKSINTSPTYAEVVTGSKSDSPPTVRQTNPDNSKDVDQGVLPTVVNENDGDDWTVVSYDRKRKSSSPLSRTSSRSSSRTSSRSRSPSPQRSDSEDPYSDARQFLDSSFDELSEKNDSSSDSDGPSLAPESDAPDSPRSVDSRRVKPKRSRKRTNNKRKTSRSNSPEIKRSNVEMKHNTSLSVLTSDPKARRDYMASLWNSVLPDPVKEKVSVYMDLDEFMECGANGSGGAVIGAKVYNKPKNANPFNLGLDKREIPDPIKISKNTHNLESFYDNVHHINKFSILEAEPILLYSSYQWFYLAKEKENRPLELNPMILNSQIYKSFHEGHNVLPISSSPFKCRGLIMTSPDRDQVDNSTGGSLAAYQNIENLDDLPKVLSLINDYCLGIANAEDPRKHPPISSFVNSIKKKATGRGEGFSDLVSEIQFKWKNVDEIFNTVKIQMSEESYVLRDLTRFCSLVLNCWSLCLCLGYVKADREGHTVILDCVRRILEQFVQSQPESLRDSFRKIFLCKQLASRRANVNQVLISILNMAEREKSIYDTLPTLNLHSSLCKETAISSIHKNSSSNKPKGGPMVNSITPNNNNNNSVKKPSDPSQEKNKMKPSFTPIQAFVYQVRSCKSRDEFITRYLDNIQLKEDYNGYCFKCLRPKHAKSSSCKKVGLPFSVWPPTQDEAEKVCGSLSKAISNLKGTSKVN